jgi:hypothetical protein
MPIEADLASINEVLMQMPSAVGRVIQANGGFDPRPGSQLLREISEQGPFVGRRKMPVMNAYSVALARLLAAMQHLSDLARLLVAPASAYGSASLVRTTFENAAWAWWALDPEIDVKRRVARGLSGMIASLNEMIMYPLESIQAEAESTRDDIAADAETHGFYVQRKERDGSPAWVEEKPPRITRLLEAQLGQPGLVAYRELSAVAHGTLFALLNRMKKADVPSVADGVALMQPSVPMDSLVLGSTLALESFWQATDRRFQLYGYDVEGWNLWVVESKNRMLPLLRKTYSKPES